MKLIDVVNGYLAAESLMRETCSYKTAAALVQLRGKLGDLADYYLGEERKLIIRYGKKNDKGGVDVTVNGFTFEDPAEAPEYNAKRQELGETDVDVEFEQKTVPAPERVSPWTLEALAPFIAFEVD